MLCGGTRSILTNYRRLQLNFIRDSAHLIGTTHQIPNTTTTVADTVYKTKIHMSKSVLTYGSVCVLYMVSSICSSRCMYLHAILLVIMHDIFNTLSSTSHQPIPLLRNRTHRSQGRRYPVQRMQRVHDGHIVAIYQTPMFPLPDYTYTLVNTPRPTIAGFHVL